MLFGIFFNLIDEVFLLAGFIANGPTFPQPLTIEEEKALFTSYKHGNDFARSELISKNLRLVAHISKKFSSRSWDSDDLISIGTVGLIKAIESFDYDKGSRLATYAARCIENEILMYIRSGKKNKTDLYLHDPIAVDTDGNEICLIDILGTESNIVHDEVENKISVIKLHESIDKVLKGNEKIIIELRYGLNCEPKTQKEIAGLLGISRSYVSRIETKALKRLKKELK